MFNNSEHRTDPIRDDKRREREHIGASKEPINSIPNGERKADTGRPSGGIVINRANINILVGKDESNNQPMIVLDINDGMTNLGFTVEEAKQLGGAILMSCGIALERDKEH